MSCENEPPCPNERTTLVGYEQISSICSTGLSIPILNGVFLQYLRLHFSNPKSLIYRSRGPERQMLEPYYWISSDEGPLGQNGSPQSTIQIQMDTEFNTQDIQKRPALYVKRNTWTPSRLTINDSAGLSKEGDQRFTIKMEGSHTIFCVGRTSAEAELLGAEVSEYFITDAPLIRQDIPLLYVFNVAQIGEISVLEESDNHFVVPVVLAYGFPYGWRLAAVKPPIKSFGVDLRARK